MLIFDIYFKKFKIEKLVQQTKIAQLEQLLLAFNIGVEFGQLAVLVIAFLLIKLVLRKNWYSNQIKIPASIIIALVGLFWFVERVFQF